MTSTAWTKDSSQSTGYTPGSSQSTGYTPGTSVGTNWGSEDSRDFSNGFLLLQAASSSLLLQNSCKLGLQ